MVREGSFLTANNLPDAWVAEKGCFGHSELTIPTSLGGISTQLGTGGEWSCVCLVAIRLTGLVRVTIQTPKKASEPHWKTSEGPNATFGDGRCVLKVVWGASGPVASQRQAHPSIRFASNCGFYWQKMARLEWKHTYDSHSVVRIPY